MSTPGWTPGPWMAVQTEREHFLIEQCPCATNVAKTFGGIPRHEEKANANLLAAAPEVYEALDLARRLLQEHHSAFVMRHEHTVCPVCDPNPFFQIDSALAKARGESQ